MLGRSSKPKAGRTLVRPFLVAACLAMLGAALAHGQATGTDHEPNAEAVVLTDGHHVETRDGFRVEGKMVVFTDLQGHLRSVPLRDVDLEASRRTAETKEKEKPAAAGDLKKPEPVLVLENDDLPRVEEAERQRALAAEAERRRVHDQAAVRSRVETGTGGGRKARPRRPISSAEGTTPGLASIGHWTSTSSRQTRGIEIVGTVVNPSAKNLDRVTVKLQMVDEDGEIVQSGRARLDRTRLQPRTSTNFRYVDPSLTSLEGLRVEFQVTARALSWGSRPNAPDDENPATGP